MIELLLLVAAAAGAGTLGIPNALWGLHCTRNGRTAAGCTTCSISATWSRRTRIATWSRWSRWSWRSWWPGNWYWYITRLGVFFLGNCLTGQQIEARPIDRGLTLKIETQLNSWHHNKLTASAPIAGNAIGCGNNRWSIGNWQCGQLRQLVLDILFVEHGNRIGVEIVGHLARILVEVSGLVLNDLRLMETLIILLIGLLNLLARCIEHQLWSILLLASFRSRATQSRHACLNQANESKEEDYKKKAGE